MWLFKKRDGYVIKMNNTKW
uniref:Uncharacterized protein n=1 Tax=Lepeophtheirus salmonis TaxID=72036 RepID=A0A0K2T3U7_LEPSM